jgi:SAM-dependent methyltransferase
MAHQLDRAPSASPIISLEASRGREADAVGIKQTLVSQSTDPHGPLGWIIAWMMPMIIGADYEDVARALELQPEDDVLDVACGSGVFLCKHASHVRYAAGIDHSRIQVSIARRRNRERISRGIAEVVQGDSAALPWADETFTAVTCNSLGCLQEPERSLQEMYRVLRPGGRVLLEVDYVPNEEAARSSEKKWGLPCWTEAELRGMLDGAGFSEILISHPRQQTVARATRR